MKLNPLDILFSEYIRKRAISKTYGCERCLQGKIDYKQLHCAHMFPRRKRSVRWDIDNAAGLCPGCHMFLDDNALDKVRFFVLLLGQEGFDLLEHRANQAGKPDEAALTLFLKAKIREIEIATADSFTPSKSKSGGIKAGSSSRILKSKKRGEK